MAKGAVDLDDRAMVFSLFSTCAFLCVMVKQINFKLGVGAMALSSYQILCSVTLLFVTSQQTFFGGNFSDNFSEIILFSVVISVVISVIISDFFRW